MAVKITQLAGDHVLAYETLNTNATGTKAWVTGLTTVKAVPRPGITTWGTDAGEPLITFSGGTVTFTMGGSTTSTFSAVAIGTVEGS